MARHITITVLTGLALSACSVAAPTASLSPTSTASPNATPTATATVSLAPVSPSAPPSGSPSPTPAPSPTPTPEGKWSALQHLGFVPFGGWWSGLSEAVDPDGTTYIASWTGSGGISLSSKSAGQDWDSHVVTKPPDAGADMDAWVGRDGGTTYLLFDRYSVFDGCWGIDCESNGVRDGTYLISNAGAGWSDPAPVDLLSDAYDAGRRQMVVRDGVVHLVYETAGPKDDSPSQIWYAVNHGSGWSKTQVASDGWGPSLTLDGDAPVIAYVGDPGGAVVYTYLDTTSGEFVPEAVPQTENGIYPRIFLAPDRAPVIVYDDNGISEIVQMGDVWLAPKPLSDHYVADMAFDSGGRLHLLYYGSDEDDNEAGVYATVWGETSEGELLDKSRRGGEDAPTAPAVVVLDGEGRPHVVIGRLDYGLDGELEVPGVYYTVGPPAPAE